MSSYVVWIDTSHAKLFNLTPQGIKTEEVKSHNHDHHGYNPRDEHREHDKFYHEVAHKLTAAVEILLVGPGVGKEQFKHHLEKHHHADVAKKILAVENMDHPTDAQVVAHAKKFFKHAHLFT